MKVLMAVALLSIPVQLIAASPQQAVVRVPVADVWSEPSNDPGKLTDDKRETQVLFGEKVLIRESSGSWVRIEAVEQPTFRQHTKWEGYPGWVLKKSLGPSRNGVTSVPIPSFPNSDVVLKFAQSVMGTAYLWGGLSEQGLDCSGLVHLAYRHDEAKIPRDAYEQWMKAKPIHRSQLQAADLIFSAKADDPKKITHVVLYAGDGMIIEAPQNGMVVRKISFKEKYGKELMEVESGDKVGERFVYFGSFLH